MLRDGKWYLQSWDINFDEAALADDLNCSICNFCGGYVVKTRARSSHRVRRRARWHRFLPVFNDTPFELTPRVQSKPFPGDTLNAVCINASVQSDPEIWQLISLHNGHACHSRDARIFLTAIRFGTLSSLFPGPRNAFSLFFFRDSASALVEITRVSHRAEAIPRAANNCRNVARTTILPHFSQMSTPTVDVFPVIPTYVYRYSCVRLEPPTKHVASLWARDKYGLNLNLRRFVIRVECAIKHRRNILLKSAIYVCDDIIGNYILKHVCCVNTLCNALYLYDWRVK